LVNDAIFPIQAELFSIYFILEFVAMAVWSVVMQFASHFLITRPRKRRMLKFTKSQRDNKETSIINPLTPTVAVWVQL